VSEKKPDPMDDDRRRRMNLVVLAVAAIIVGIGIYLVFVLANDLRIQNCVMEGRRDCVPMPRTTQ
jgi:hypothetical protein